MATKHRAASGIPKDYVQLEGSELSVAPATKALGPADPNETFSVTIVLRRRPDGPPIPGSDYFVKTPLRQRRRLSQDEFAAKYGAAPQDTSKVVEFARSHGLAVIETHAARRTVVVSGTVAQMENAFGVTLERYQHNIPGGRGEKPRVEIFRGHEGFIHIPRNLTGIIVGVFGLDDRTITQRNGTTWTSQNGNPTNTKPVSVAKMTTLYNFPTNSAAGQTIGIFATGGYFPSDLASYFGASMPTITPIQVNAPNFYVEAKTSAAAAAGGSVLNFASTAGISTNSYVVGPVFQNISISTKVTAVTATSVTLSQPLAAVFNANSIVYFLAISDGGETTQDICIAGAAAPGANIAVYFNSGGQVGWVAALQRLIHPSAGDPVCSVLSSSFYISDGDDAATLANENHPASMILAVHALFQDAALQGVTICIAAGDTGSNSKVGANPAAWGRTFAGDGKAHVQYPGSDPWVLCVGGTTVGGATLAQAPPPWLEYVWNDPVPTFTTNPSQWGTTGGGVSDFFTDANGYGPTYDYQKSGNVPLSVNDGHVGRGVPDVAANASLNSGYSGLTYFGKPFVGNGTSASAPLWAGLIATLNAAMSNGSGAVTLGFVNPMLYALGSSVFRDINPITGGGPTDNSNDGIAGYPAGAGWDACTGWGSPNGTALLAALQQQFAQDCYFIVDQGVFQQSPIAAELQQASAVFQQAFFVVVEGYSPNQLGVTAATVSNPVANPPGAQPSFTPAPLASPLGGVNFVLASVQPMDPSLFSSNPSAAQRMTYAYNVVFTDVSAFPATVTITAAVAAFVNGTNVTVSSSADLQFANTPSPYFAGSSGVAWLSDDLRVFQVEQGATWQAGPNYQQTVNATGNITTTATSFIQKAITAFNLPANSPPPNHPFDFIPTDINASALDLLQSDPNNNNTPVLNFAVARVRYDSAAASAPKVRVFFRLMPALSTSMSYDPNGNYRHWSDGKTPPDIISLWGADASQNVTSIPFFATKRVIPTTVSLTTQTDVPNVQNIASGNAETYAYFGCWLDINQPNQLVYPANNPGAILDGPFGTTTTLQPILTILGGMHQCIVAEIDYDPDPIVNGYSPSTSGPMAQRNLSLVQAANPGDIGSRRVPNTFTIRPTPTSIAADDRADELMIDWGNTPAGSAASIYWPQVSAAQVIQMADTMYLTHNLTMSDRHTLAATVGGITYIPIPPGSGEEYVGLISVDLPLGIRDGQSFNIIVRQLTSVAPPRQKQRTTELLKWRRVLGTFQIAIAVKTKAVMLAPEERSLSLIRWIQQSVPETSRWFPIFRRYAAQIAERVRGLGGDPDAVVASPTGNGIQPSAECENGAGLAFTGKVTGLKYDSFGDFDGFLVRTDQGDERSFQSREREIEALVNRAWIERIVLSVFVRPSEPHHPASIVLRSAPPPKI